MHTESSNKESKAAPCKYIEQKHQTTLRVDKRNQAINNIKHGHQGYYNGIIFGDGVGVRDQKLDVEHSSLLLTIGTRQTYIKTAYSQTLLTYYNVNRRESCQLFIRSKNWRHERILSAWSTLVDLYHFRDQFLQFCWSQFILVIRLTPRQQPLIY